MNNKVKIAVDAMGGENAPKKIIKGIQISLKKNKENYFYLFGNKNLLEEELKKNNLTNDHCEIIDCKDTISDDESPLPSPSPSPPCCIILPSHLHSNILDPPTDPRIVDLTHE